MNRAIQYVAFGVSLAVIAWPADAEIFKCTDKAGKVTYAEKKDPQAVCTPVTGSVNVVPTIPRPNPPTPPSAPSSPTVEKSGPQRDDLQKQIAAEEAALASAKKDLAEQENIREGGERNYQRVEDRLKPYQDKVAEIEKKLAQLREQASKGQ